MQQDHILNTLNFDVSAPLPGRGWGSAGKNICYHVAAACVIFLKTDVQHDHILKKKMNFDLLTPPSKSTQGVGPRPSI